MAHDTVSYRGFACSISDVALVVITRYLIKFIRRKYPDEATALAAALKCEQELNSTISGGRNIEVEELMADKRCSEKIFRGLQEFISEFSDYGQLVPENVIKDLDPELHYVRNLSAGIIVGWADLISDFLKKPFIVTAEEHRAYGIYIEDRYWLQGRSNR